MDEIKAGKIKSIAILISVVIGMVFLVAYTETDKEGFRIAGLSFIGLVILAHLVKLFPLFLSSMKILFLYKDREYLGMSWPTRFFHRLKDHLVVRLFYSIVLGLGLLIGGYYFDTEILTWASYPFLGYVGLITAWGILRELIIVPIKKLLK